MSQSDSDYYRQRAAIEREMARSAASETIASIHEELAQGYEGLARKSVSSRGTRRAVG